MDPAPGAVAATGQRPRRIWYVVAALIAASGVLAAAAVLFLVPSGGDIGQRITLGQPVTMRVPEAGSMVWARGDGRDLLQLRCVPSQADIQRLEEWSTVSMRRDDLTLDAGGERWRALLLVRAKPAGRYTVICTVSGADATPSVAIGDPPRFHDARSKALAMLVAAALASLGVLVAAVMAVVVAVRRR